MAASIHRRAVRPDEWYVCIEVRELAVLRDGRRAPRGAASRNLCYSCCFRDSSEIRLRSASAWPASALLGGEPVSGDRVIRFATAAVVCAVAAFAAVVSYSHIYGLARAHGQDGTAARLLPLSVDGLILAASLVLLHEARNDRDAPRLARYMLARHRRDDRREHCLRRGIRAARRADLSLARGGVHRRGGDRDAAGETFPRATRGHQRAGRPPRRVMWSRRSARPTRRRSRLVPPLSQRAMAERFGLSRRRVSQLITSVTVESNGHALAGKGARR